MPHYHPALDASLQDDLRVLLASSEVAPTVGLATNDQGAA